MTEFLNNTHWSVHGLLALVFVLALAESLLVVGLLVPGVALLSAATLIAAEQNIHPGLWWLCGGLGAFCGDGLSFVAGSWLGHRLDRLRLFREHPQWLPRAQDFFRRYGAMSIALGRFVGPLRPVVPAVAGAAGMRPLTFWWVNLLSSAAWAAVYLLPVYWLGKEAGSWLPGWALALFVLLATVLALIVSRYAVRR